MTASTMLSHTPFRLAVVAGCLLLSCGCGAKSLPYTGVKRIDEKVTQAELEAFFAVIDSLPENDLPDFPDVFAQPPDWKPQRTLPVNELLQEEEARIDRRWQVEWLAGQLHDNRALRDALREHRMTPEQFAGLWTTLGAALSRRTLRDDQDLDRLIERGEAVLDRLQQDQRQYSALSREERYRVLRQATWATRRDRAERLKSVPPENVDLVKRHSDRLSAVFSGTFTTNPLDPIVDVREKYGIPFEELPESGSDAEIEWDPDEAIVGTDPPDKEFRRDEGAP